MYHRNGSNRYTSPEIEKKCNLLISSLVGESCEEIDQPAVYHLFKTLHQRESSSQSFLWIPEEGGHWSCLHSIWWRYCDAVVVNRALKLGAWHLAQTCQPWWHSVSHFTLDSSVSSPGKMSFGPNDIRSKILKCWCPRFAALQSFQTNPRFGSHPDWFTDVLSKTILWNMWNGTGILPKACKSVLIVLWIGHANFHLCLGHFELIGTSICFSSVFILLPSSLHNATNDLDMFLSLYFWCPKLDSFFEDPENYRFIQKNVRLFFSQCQ